MRNVCFLHKFKPTFTVSTSKHMTLSITTPLVTTVGTCSVSQGIMPFLQAFRQYSEAAAAVVAVHSTTTTTTVKQQCRKNVKKLQSPITALDRNTNNMITAEIPHNIQKSPIRPAEASIAITKLSRQGRSREALSIFIRLLQKSGYGQGSEDWVFPSHGALYSLAHALYKDRDLHNLLFLHDTLLQRFLSKHHWQQLQQYRYHYNKRAQQRHSSLSTQQHAISNCSKKEAKTTLYIYTMLFNLLAKKTSPSLYQIRMLCYELSLLPINKPTVPYYNTLIDLLLQHRHRKQAFAVYQELVKRSEPSIVTYTILMNDAAKRGRYGKMMEYLEQIDKHRLKMDYGISSVVVKALCQTGHFDLAKSVVLQLERQRHMFQQLQQQQYQKKSNEQDPLCSKSFKQNMLRWIEKRQRQWQKKKNC